MSQETVSQEDEFDSDDESFQVGEFCLSSNNSFFTRILKIERNKNIGFQPFHRKTVSLDRRNTAVCGRRTISQRTRR